MIFDPVFFPSIAIYFTLWIALTIFPAIALLTPFNGLVMIALVLRINADEARLE